MAPSALAASLTPIQINAITNLLQAFGADSAVIANVQAVLEGTATSTVQVQTSGRSGSSEGSAQSAIGNTSCAVLSGNLGMGSTGEDVSRLQAFLGKDKNIYPAGSVTGYFGRMTEDAVKNWQTAHNIVSDGTPGTTGFGVVGPHTRSEMDTEMETECGQGDNNNRAGTKTASSTSMNESNSNNHTASSTSTEN